MQVLKVGNQTFQGEDPGLQGALQQVHGTKIRPRCMCRVPGIEMYVAKVHGRFLAKRMPDTGPEHAPTCDSYEPPAELSGLGEVLGAAIQESPDDGTTALKLSFSLSKGTRPAPEQPIGSGERDTAKTDGTKLTLKALLHYLWDQAGFTRWSPAMAGKRSWPVLRKFLLQAADGKVAKRYSLNDLLYVPEPFVLDKKLEIAQRRMSHIMKVTSPTGGAKRMMILLGEVKEFSPARYGHKALIKHVPDMPFMMNEDIFKRMSKRFADVIALNSAMEGTKLIMMGTFSYSNAGVASVEEVALMLVTENWVPIDHAFDKMLLDVLTQNGYHFIKGLRYNMPSSRPLACVVLPHTRPEPTAMYIVAPGAPEEYLGAVNDVIAASKMPSWLWVAGSDAMPPLPPLVS